ncbi:hypothetical protein NE683_12200 [Bariatricus massiliensis]|uniref:HTH cro/C1-type domain-containing protein n=1 Tax=Bariatricus massiliensis TaxID=1745713 RepID=A0ABS8DGZ3_9FIRM|nr:hypothetical protein [Bariatricus massiliensis]MCB7306157.1 hypothetical protein [Bariatricus massiliensis]MCB7375235.1 hypothetical protein [Bariatricus massiliensis]MCB7387695.1 hypothetical protein [Bariatricus massiliensis]MCB7411856.1 hypothetical protein [Bariatricus massiliensis]MCQ5253992.1 hypothetical protein [Bariatricus massiliensis]
MAKGTKKVKLDYQLLCRKIKESGKTQEEFSYELGRSKSYVYSLKKSIEQPESMEKLMCLLLGLEPGSLIDTGGSNGEVKALENIFKMAHETDRKISEVYKLLKAIIENTEELEVMKRKISANTVQLEKIKESMLEQQRILKEFE